MTYRRFTDAEVRAIRADYAAMQRESEVPRSGSKSRPTKGSGRRFGWPPLEVKYGANANALRRIALGETYAHVS